MKTITVLSILFCVIALPALGELTDADLDKIRLIVKEELKTEITAVREELKTDITSLKQEMKAEIASSEKNIKEYVNVRIESVEKRLSTYNWVIYALIPLMVAAIGMPTALIAWRSGRDRSLERQVEMLIQEMETLKKQRIVNP